MVTEREKGLRQALRTMGMLDSAFWGSWMVTEIVVSLIFTLLLIAFGAMFQFSFFLKNSFGLVCGLCVWSAILCSRPNQMPFQLVLIWATQPTPAPATLQVFLLFFLFQWAMISFAFFISTWISKGSAAVNLGFVIFIVGWISQSIIAFGYPYTPGVPGWLEVECTVWVCSLIEWRTASCTTLVSYKSTPTHSSLPIPLFSCREYMECPCTHRCPHPLALVHAGQGLD